MINTISLDQSHVPSVVKLFNVSCDKSVLSFETTPSPKSDFSTVRTALESTMNFQETGNFARICSGK